MAVIKNMRSSTKKKTLILLGLLLGYIVLQLLSSTGVLSNQQKGWLIPICYNIILAVSLNVTVGILGELSLGHAGFMCVGAFTGAFIVKMFTVISPDASKWIVYPIAFVAAGILAAIFGLIIGIPVLRLKGDYLAIVTLAFGEIIWNLLSVTRVSFDNGKMLFRLGGTSIENASPDAVKIIDGAQGITRGIGINSKYGFTIAFVLMFLTVWIVLNFIHSRTGRIVMSIRDNRIAAESVGINVNKYKLIALALSAFLAGIGGVLYALKNGQAVANQATYGYIMSINILVFVVLGGMGSTLGSIIAAIILTILPDWLRFLNNYRMLIYAIVLIGVMLFSSNPTLKSYVDSVKNKIKSFFIKKPVKTDKEVE